jgi:hypothetical protein
MALRPMVIIVAMAVLAMLFGSCSDPPSATNSSSTLPSATAPGSGDPQASPSAGEGWVRLPVAPLTPRRNAYAFPIGSQVIVAGGSDAKPCPPNAMCPWNEHPLSDGAAYDMGAGSWMPIAPAPKPLGLGTSAMSGSTAFIWLWGDPPAPDFSTAAFVSFDAPGDRWDVLPRPPRVPDASFLLASVPGGVVAYAPTDEAGGPDYWYDGEGRAWRELPDDPLGHSFGRSMVWAGDELILLAPELVPQPNSEEPALLRVAAFDPATWAWRRLTDSDILAGDPDWYSAGGQVVNPSIEASDGGETNGWGRMIPGGGTLDPSTGRWTPLPRTPGECDCYGRLAAGSQRFLLNRQGWVLDLAGWSWLPLPMPDGAPDEGEATAWVADKLFVFGGNTIRPTSTSAQPRPGQLLNDALVWTPPQP